MIEYEEDDEEEALRGVDLLDEQGLRVMSGPCSTCIFRPGNLMHLHPGRVKGMVDAVVEHDGFTPCHKTLSQRPATLCHGMTKRHPGQIVRVFTDMGYIHEIDPEEVEHD